MSWRPTGLADGLAHGMRYPAAMPGFAPNNRFPRSTRPRWIRPMLERAAVYARRPDGGPRGGWLSWSAAAPWMRGPLTLMKTYVANSLDRERNWLLVDAEGQTLGRLATQIADALRGKRKPVYTPHVDTGDFVVVVNAEKISVTGQKLEEKMYYRHSGYPGGLRERTLREQLERQPTEVLRKAVKGMLPRNKLGRAQLTKLKIYAGPEHPHEAQAPTTLEV